MLVVVNPDVTVEKLKLIRFPFHSKAATETDLGAKDEKKSYLYIILVLLSDLPT